MPESEINNDPARLQAIKEGMAQDWQEEKIISHHSPPEAQPDPESEQGTVATYEKIPAYFDPESQAYYRKSEDGEWQKASAASMRRFLKTLGFSTKPGEESLTSPLEEALEYIETRKKLDYAGQLAGFPAGFHYSNGLRILVTRGPKLITLQKGDWPNLKQVFEGLLGEEQALWFYLWMKVAVEALRDFHLRPGQFLIVAGPVKCGKSLLQSLITVLLGGRMACPMASMMGKTDFNSDLFNAEHLMIEDDAGSADPRVRRHFASEIKQKTVNRLNRCHKKQREALTLPTLWRITMTLNDDAPSLQVLPQLDAGIKDKLILLKASSFQMPVDTSTPEGEEQLWECLVLELPAFVDYLNELEIPEDRKSDRFRVTHYHNPDLLSLMDAASDELKLLELIDSTEELFGMTDQEWIGRASELEKILRDEHGVTAGRIFPYQSACGTLLGLLADKEKWSNPRVEKLAIRNGYNQWRIFKLKN